MSRFLIADLSSLSFRFPRSYRSLTLVLRTPDLPTKISCSSLAAVVRRMCRVGGGVLRRCALRNLHSAEEATPTKQEAPQLRKLHPCAHGLHYGPRITIRRWLNNKRASCPSGLNPRHIPKGLGFLETLVERGMAVAGHNRAFAHTIVMSFAASIICITGLNTRTTCVAHTAVGAITDVEVVTVRCDALSCTWW